MAITYFGANTFRDSITPVPGKTPWGIDTLIRKIDGPVSGLEDYIASLQQGFTYLFNGQTYYLQTWETNDDKAWPLVTLNYKGLFAGIPTPFAVNDIVQESGSISADYSTQNDGQGLLYGVDSDGNNLYCLGATHEWAARVPQTIWHYITFLQPNGPSYGSLGFAGSIVVTRNRIITSDGTVFGGLAPVPLAVSLALYASNQIISFRSSPIFGTPYFECEDVVIATYPSN
jgi:hypothetical protein